MDNQKTIKKEVIIRGIRQSDGLDTFIKFTPTDKGLWIKYGDIIEPISPHIMNNQEKRFTNSVLTSNGVVTMVEHVFSAVNGLGIDNLIVEFGSDEAPFFANSEKIARTLSKEIVSINHRHKEYYRVEKTIKIKGNNGQYCKITPCNDFKVNITIDFKGIIGKQFFSYSFRHSDYLNEIAPARSILIFEIKDIKSPWKNFKEQFKYFPCTLPDNPRESPYIAYTNKEFLTPLKDQLEPVKHKLLDFIGDITLLGKIPMGKFELNKPGHSFNRKIVSTIFNLAESYNLQFDYFLKKIPEIKTLEHYVENNKVHKNETVLEHTKKTFKNTLEIMRSYKLELDIQEKKRILLAVLLHDYGKKDVLCRGTKGITSCDNHEFISAKNIKKEGLLNRFNITDQSKNWILSFIKNHAKMHSLFVEDDNVTKKNLEEFKKDHPKDYIENLIFSIADIKETYLKISDKKEYDRRINILNRKLLEILTPNTARRKIQKVRNKHKTQQRIVTRRK